MKLIDKLFEKMGYVSKIWYDDYVKATTDGNKSLEKLVFKYGSIIDKYTKMEELKRLYTTPCSIGDKVYVIIPADTLLVFHQNAIITRHSDEKKNNLKLLELTCSYFLINSNEIYIGFEESSEHSVTELVINSNNSNVFYDMDMAIKKIFNTNEENSSEEEIICTAIVKKRDIIAK